MALILKSFITSLCLVLLAGCSSFGSNTKASLSKNIGKIPFKVASSEQRVIIYNHGIYRPQELEPCFLFYNQAPKSLISLRSDNTLIYQLCSKATESPVITSAGKQVYLRKKEIDFAIDAFLDRGIHPKNLFLSGHSNGGWTSLMMMKDVNKRFNGVIAYAPAFAGKRAEKHLAPWWLNVVQPKQIRDMLKASEMDALVFAYDNDSFNRPEDLQFLTKHYPQSNNSGVDLVSYDCGLKEPHHTFRIDCQLDTTSKKIKQFVENQIDSWSN